MANYNKNTLSQLPGPKKIPLLGNILQLKLSKLHLILEEWADNYGDIYTFKIFNKPVVVIANTEIINYILRERPDTYRRIKAMEDLSHEYEAQGLITAEGDKWRWQRRVTMQAFRVECMRAYFPKMQAILQRLYKLWDNCAENNMEVEVGNDWMRLLVDITTNFAFGYDINTLGCEGGDFQRHLIKQIQFFNRRINSPFPYWRFITLDSDREANKSLIFIKETISKFILQAQQKLEKHNNVLDQPANFLEAMLMAVHEDGKSFSYDEIQGNIIDILLAGEDTTANTLSWLVYFITQDNEIQEKMQQEADSVLLEEIIPTNLKAVERLVYIEAVILETLRMKSVLPIIALEPIKDVVLDGVVIQQGTTLMLVTRYIALQEKNFIKARQFKPERWLDASSDPIGCPHNKNASLPFGAGPRACPGRNLAMMEMKMAMAMVCKNFNVTRVNPDQPVQEVFSFTLMPDNLKVKLEKRKPI